MDGAAHEAQSRGYHVAAHRRADRRRSADGVGRRISQPWSRARPTCRRPTCIVSSGETTVRVTGQGKGGRNQEFALAAATPLAALAVPAVVASAGTDGIDGPTDAAGALVDSSTLERAAAAGVGPPGAFLANNDAYAFFAAAWRSPRSPARPTPMSAICRSFSSAYSHQ